ncbi:hypothetical protein BCR39DRAFT_544088 [Naematelia encephala]|uniref:Uncharacterized protein n=1 Tax=Naematelia encephala TaxID=71784 RepID=A0A1Y2ATA5_9TREE|nr:hypothetical protein BCR39DRAFT_544088 [Naematelia encephala]
MANKALSKSLQALRLGDFVALLFLVCFEEAHIIIVNQLFRIRPIERLALDAAHVWA